VLDELQKALDTGGMQGLAAAIAKVTVATDAAARSSARFNGILTSNRGVRTHLVDQIKTQQQTAINNRLVRDRIALEARLASVRSGSFARTDTATRALDAEKQRVQAFEEMARLAGRMQDVKSGQFALTASDKQAVALQSQKVSLAERESLVKEGVYAEGLKGQMRLQREQRKIEEMEKRAAYEARLGRRLGGIAYGADALGRSPFGAVARGAAGAAGMAGVAATGAAMHGFQGTVEWNRLQLEVDMVSRELAGAFLPAIQWATKGLQGLRNWLESLSQRDQNRLMLGAMAFGGVGAAGILARGAGAIGGGLAGGAALLGRFGSRAAPSIMAGGNWSGFGGASSAAAGAGMMSRAGSVAGKVVGGAGAVYAGVTTMKEQYEDMSSDPNTMRAFGRQMLRAPDMLMGGEAARMFGFKSGGPLGQAYDAAFGSNQNAGGGQQVTESGSRRRVTLAAAGFEQSGAAFERVTNKLALTATGQEEKSTESLLDQIMGFLQTTFGKSAPPRMESK
jgi:hypothetical protein